MVQGLSQAAVHYSNEFAAIRLRQMIKQFRSYKEATRYASEVAKTNRETIRVVRSGPYWTISSHKLQNRVNEPVSDHREGEHEMHEDYDLTDAQNEIQIEMGEAVQNYARSEEEGWFYPEIEGDWQDNVADPSTEDG
jgi:hypothetical protein